MNEGRLVDTDKAVDLIRAIKSMGYEFTALYEDDNETIKITLILKPKQEKEAL